MSASTSAPAPLSLRLLVTLTVLVGGGAAALGGWEFADAEDRVVGETLARAAFVGESLQAEIDAPYLETLATILPDRDSVWSWDGHGTELATLHAAFAEAAERYGFEEIRALRPTEDAVDILKHYGGELHRGALHELVASGERPAWQSPAIYFPEMRQTWKKGKPTHRIRRSLTRGAAVEAWLPLEDAHGNTLALLELTDNVQDELAAARTRAAWVTAAAAFVALLAIGLAVRQAMGDEGALERLGRSLRRLGGGDLDTPVRAGGDALLGAVEAARRALQAQKQDIEARLLEAEGRTRASEALLDGRTAERREAIARVACGPVLVIDAGGSRRESAELVDLSFTHLVLRVQTYTMIDLAPGMPATVCWVDAEDGAIELTVARRTETPAGLEYVFVLESGELPGTPPEIACIAYARATERVTCQFTEVTATLLAGLGGPLSCQVLDLSADGCGLMLPVRPSALSSTGTRPTFMLQLGVDEEELTFGVFIRSVRPVGDGCFCGLQFDPEMTGDYDARRAKVAGWVTEQLREAAMAQAGEYAA